VAVKKAIGKQELETLGEQMETMFEKMITRDPREDIPNETNQAAPVG
jgi:hypothetical protein